MPDFGALAKGGWHPKGKDGGKESWRGDFKGMDQVSKWMGKGDRKTEDKDERIAQPIKSLKDPSSFAPPPKHTSYYGGAVATRPNQPTKGRVGSGTSVGASRSTDTNYTEDVAEEEEEEEKSKAPSLPFRANTTGLRTDHLPPPPGRKDGADGRSATAGVFVLTIANFDDTVYNNAGKPTLVNFYSPSCEYCQELDPVYEKLAQTFQAYSNVITIAKLDCKEHQKLGVRLGIQNYPTLKYFNGKNRIAEDYLYGRDLQSLTDFMTEKTSIRPGARDIRNISSRPTTAHPPVPRPKPGLPPRLPPRQNSNPGENAPAPPPTYHAAVQESVVNERVKKDGAVGRLGAAGVSVPALEIGSRRSILPPPTPSRTNTSSPARDSAFSPPVPVSSKGDNSSQLSELQGRFARFGTSSNTPKEVPAQGTTWSQKQAALKTVQSFQKDPTSVSLSDARAAASTANNFHERHGDQVAAGHKSANKFNSKYGISDMVGKYGTSGVGPRSPSATPLESDTASQSIQMFDRASTIKKAAPPPPPKKKPAFAPAADTGSGPPPIPLSSKPKPATSSKQLSMTPHGRENLDLDLKSLWFSRGTFPPPTIVGLPGGRSYSSSSGWSSSGGRKTHTLNGMVRHTDDLSATKIRLTWDGNAPGLTVKAEQKYIPPPRSLSNAELEDFRQQYSAQIAKWCEERMGTQVGNGECWTLANEALKAVAAEKASVGSAPCLSSQSLLHGYEIYSFLPPAPCEPPGGVLAAGVGRGDIIQFRSAHFKRKDGMGQSWAGAPDHTAVVTSVERGGAINVVESNAGGVKNVQTGCYKFDELVGGEIHIFRAVAEDWVGPMDPSW